MRESLLMKLKYLLILSAFLLAGCSTPYQPFSFLGGGYASSPAWEDYLKVRFDGNALTSDLQAQRYVLFRIAQIGKKRAKKYFVMYQTITDIANNNKAISPAFYSMLNKPESYAYVRYSNKWQPGALSVDATYDKYVQYINQ